ncbi:MAG: hypothetical protein LBI69_04705 [Puniceicoccales bacterium]|jgi:hypothetical protein|nr:hypothetical protein [Puniceicoccales bacterium]
MEKTQKAMANDAPGKVCGSSKCVNVCTLVVILISVVTCPILAAVGVLPVLPALLTPVGCAIIGFGIMIFVGEIFRRDSDSNQEKTPPVVKENQNANLKDSTPRQKNIIQSQKVVHVEGNPPSVDLNQTKTPPIKEITSTDSEGSSSQRENIIQSPEVVHVEGNPPSVDLNQTKTPSIAEVRQRIEAFSLDELIERIPTEDHLYKETYAKRFNGYIFDPQDCYSKIDHNAKSWAKRGDKEEGSDSIALERLCNDHGEKVKEFLVACELVKITQLKEGGKEIVEAIRSGHWENALCADVKRLNVATHAVMQAIGGGNFIEGRRGLFERIMPLYRAFLDATSKFAIHNSGYLLAISRDVFEKNSWEVKQKNEEGKDLKDDEMKKVYGDRIKTMTNQSGHSVRMCVACGYDVREIVTLNKSWFGGNVRTICQGCNENQWLDTNFGGKCHLLSTLYDFTQGPLSAWIDPFGICIRFHMSIGGSVESVVGGTGIDIINKHWGILRGIDYENLHDNDDRMKKDAALLKEKSRYIATLPQVCMAADGTEFLYGACGGMSLEGKGNLLNKYREMCLNVLLPQYEMLAEIAKMTWQREEEGRPVVLNLFQLGMGAYNNDPSILGNFLDKVLEVLDGTGVIVVLHAYSGLDRQRWENAFEVTGIRDSGVPIIQG